MIKKMQNRMLKYMSNTNIQKCKYTRITLGDLQKLHSI